MLKATPTPKPEPAWLTQTKGALGKLQSEAAPVQLTRQQVWIALGGLVLAWWFFCLCVSQICRKAGRPGGALAWLPVVQLIPMFRAAGMSGWWFVAMFIPVLNLIGQVLWCVKITQARGKGFVTAVMLMMTIDTSLNRLFRVQRSRPMLQQVLMYWAVITLGPVLIGLSQSMTSFEVGASFGWLRLSIVADAVLGVLPLLFTCAALTLLYAIVPYRHVRARDALIGGVLAVFAFVLA